MRSGRVVCTAFVLACALGVACGRTQTMPGLTAGEIPQATEDSLHAMSQQAGVIFTGQVIAVNRHDGADGAAGVVDIGFAVDWAIRGVSGATYTLHEWAGLWPAGEEPFRVGQRYLMLLHTPGLTGLSSPASGPDGAIPIRAADDARETAVVVDLRWVATGAVRQETFQVDSVAHPIGGPVVMRPNVLVTGKRSGSEARPANASSAVSARPNNTYGAILALLRGWEKETHATR
ncbi:MAG TPA: hypothetical protein VGN01_20510 [Acidobacteriaceae bacterium]